MRHDQALGEGAVGDRALDELDADRIVVDAEHARGFARRRADATRDSGKLFVACSAWIASSGWFLKTWSFQSGIRFPSGQPVLQNGMPQSMQRAPCLRDRFLNDGELELAPVSDALRDGSLLGIDALELEKTCDFAHGVYLLRV